MRTYKNTRLLRQRRNQTTLLGYWIDCIWWRCDIVHHKSFFNYWANSYSWIWQMIHFSPCREETNLSKICCCFFFLFDFAQRFLAICTGIAFNRSLTHSLAHFLIFIHFFPSLSLSSSSLTLIGLFTLRWICRSLLFSSSPFWQLIRENVNSLAGKLSLSLRTRC